MQFRRAVIIGAISVLAGAPGFVASATADPLLLTFNGTWNFHDPRADQPAFWNAMAGAGITTGTALTFTMLLDTLDQNPDPLSDIFPVQSTVQVGNVTLTSTASTLNVLQLPASSSFPATTTADIRGAQWTGSPVGPWLPSYMQLSFSGANTGPLPVNDHLALMTFFNAFPVNRLFIGFEQPGACGLCMGLSTLRLTSVQTVPETSQVIWLGVGALSWAMLRRSVQSQKSRAVFASSQRHPA